MLKRQNKWGRVESADLNYMQGELQRLATLVDEAKVPIFMVDMHGIITTWNKGCEGLWGYSAEELIGKATMSKICPRTGKQLEANFREGHFIGRELEYVAKDGNLIPCTTSTFLVRDLMGSPIGIGGTAEDIRDRKWAERRLQESEKKCQEFLDNAPVGVIKTNMKGDILYANEALSRMLEFESTEEMMSESTWGRCENIIDRAAFPEELTRKGKLANFEFKALTKTGKTKNLIMSGSLESDVIWGMAVDITEYKRLEEALQESEGKYGALVENSPNMVGICRQGFFQYVNRAMCEKLGWTYEEFTSPHFDAIDGLIPRKSARDISRENVVKRLRGEKIPPHEMLLQARDGSEIPVVAHTQTILYHGEPESHIVFVDITELKQAEEELRRYQEHLEQSVQQRTAQLKNINEQLREEITERKQAEETLRAHQDKLRSLASELSLAEERERRRVAVEMHDRVGQSLALCRMKLRTLEESPASTGIAEPLNEIRGIIEDLLEETRSLTFELSSPLLYMLGLEAALERLTEQIGERHGIRSSFEDDGEPKPLDNDVRILLFQVVRELLANVTKHARARNVRVSLKKHDRQIRVVVEDDGIGFDANRMVFDPKSTRGFGLFGIRERLDSIGGHIHIESEPGHGTRATIMAPLKCE